MLTGAALHAVLRLAAAVAEVCTPLHMHGLCAGRAGHKLTTGACLRQNLLAAA